MAYSIETKNIILAWLQGNKSAAEISRMQSNKPCASTILRWKKGWVQDGSLEGNENNPQSPQRKNWALSDYEAGDIKESQESKIKCKKSWQDLLGDGADVGYRPSSTDFCASYVRKKIHGSSIEDDLHLGILQVRESGSNQVRTKTIQETKLKITSQNHIYPHSKMQTEINSYNPNNVREGNAAYNSAIGNSLDPIFTDQGRSLSESTKSILRQYSIKHLTALKEFEGTKRAYKKYLEKEVTFKYTDQGKIVSSNMVSALEKSPKGSFEAPELCIMDGPTNLASLRAYSVPLYRIDSEAGILDTSMGKCHGKVIESPGLFDE